MSSEDNLEEKSTLINKKCIICYELQDCHLLTCCNKDHHMCAQCIKSQFEHNLLKCTVCYERLPFKLKTVNNGVVRKTIKWKNIFILLLSLVVVTCSIITYLMLHQREVSCKAQPCYCPNNSTRDPGCPVDKYPIQPPCYCTNNEEDTVLFNIIAVTVIIMSAIIFANPSNEFGGTPPEFDQIKNFLIHVNILFLSTQVIFWIVNKYTSPSASFFTTWVSIFIWICVAPFIMYILVIMFKNMFNRFWDTENRRPKWLQIISILLILASFATYCACIIVMNNRIDACSALPCYCVNKSSDRHRCDNFPIQPPCKCTETMIDIIITGIITGLLQLAYVIMLGDVLTIDRDFTKRAIRVVCITAPIYLMSAAIYYFGIDPVSRPYATFWSMYTFIIICMLTPYVLALLYDIVRCLSVILPPLFMSTTVDPGTVVVVPCNK